MADAKDRTTIPVLGFSPSWVLESLKYGVPLCVMIFFLNFAWNGTSAISELLPGSLQYMVDMAESPLSFHGNANYYQESPFFYFLAHAVGATTVRSYLALCTAAIALTYLLFYTLSTRRMGKELGMVAFLLFLAHPITYILHTWVGMVDPVTVLCSLVLLFTRSWIVALGLSAAAVFNHPAILLVAPAILVLRKLSDPADVSSRLVLGVVFGLALGKWFTVMAFHLSGFVPYSRLDYMLDIPVKDWFASNARQFPLSVYSFGFAVWIPLVVMWWYYYRENTRLFTAYAICLCVFFAVTFFCKDTTRVFALLSWAPTIHMLINTWRLASQEQDRRAHEYRSTLVFAGLFGWLAPHLFVWDGAIYAPGLQRLGNVLGSAVGMLF